MARPLTKCSKNGEPYTRLVETEEQIDEVLTQPLEKVVDRARTIDVGEPGFVRDEVLVHLYRLARRASDEENMYGLVKVLLSRCEKLLAGKISSRRWANVEEVRDEVLGQFSELLATDNSTEDRNQLDYFEVRFNLAFRALRIGVIRKFGQRDRESPLPNGDEARESMPDETRFALLSSALCVPPSQERDVAEQELHEAINALPDDEHRAVVLTYLLGYPIESEDKTKKTVAKLCGVSGRTIRTRLKRAYARLAPYVEAMQV